MQLLIARHAETTWNVERRIQGWTDSPLTAHGTQQARALGERLRTVKLAAVYCSDSPRAIMTAECVALWHDLEVIPMQSLRESSWGDWEGLTADEIERRYPQLWQKFVERGKDGAEDDADWEANSLVPGGESMSEASERLGSALSELRVKHGKSKDIVLAVGHGGSLRYLFTRVLGVRPYVARKMHLDNASLSEIWFSPDKLPVIHCLNDISHLSGVLAI